METLWFIVVTLMLAVFIVLDGFDFGVGMVYPFVVGTEAERRMVLASIGPLWNANEVWLIAAGAVLFFASDLSAFVTGQCLQVNGGG
mgnify:CR=1 FL=1